MFDVEGVPTIDQRERELTYLAYDLAEKQLRDGSAKAQVITQFLQAGSPRQAIAIQMMQQKMAYMEAKMASLAASQQSEILLEETLRALKTYRGENPDAQIL